MDRWTCEADVDAAKKNYLIRIEQKRKGDVDEDGEGDGGSHKKSRPNQAPNPRDEFKTFSLNLPANAYPHLRKTVSLEPTGEGRQGAVLVYPDPENGTPIVRSTTKFMQPAQIFQPLHHQLANEIVTLGELPIPLNNCLVEVMDNSYTGLHTDFESKQAQDLVFSEDSFICLFSCYKDPKTPSRKLVVQSKMDPSIMFDIPLLPNSVVVWSLETNSYYRHKIVLDQEKATNPENLWMGFTFHTSQTCIQYVQLEGDTQPRPYFGNGMPLLLLEGERACSTIHRLRELENEGSTFVYPSCLMSTISPGDLLPPTDQSEDNKKEN